MSFEKNDHSNLKGETLFSEPFLALRNNKCVFFEPLKKCIDQLFHYQIHLQFFFCFLNLQRKEGKNDYLFFLMYKLYITVAPPGAQFICPFFFLSIEVTKTWRLIVAIKKGGWFIVSCLQAKSDNGWQILADARRDNRSPDNLERANKKAVVSLRSAGGIVGRTEMHKSKAFVQTLTMFGPKSGSVDLQARPHCGPGDKWLLVSKNRYSVEKQCVISMFRILQSGCRTRGHNIICWKITVVDVIVGLRGVSFAAPMGLINLQQFHYDRLLTKKFNPQVNCLSRTNSGQNSNIIFSKFFAVWKKSLVTVLEVYHWKKNFANFLKIVRIIPQKTLFFICFFFGFFIVKKKLNMHFLRN